MTRLDTLLSGASFVLSAAQLPFHPLNNNVLTTISDDCQTSDLNDSITGFGNSGTIFFKKLFQPSRFTRSSARRNSVENTNRVQQPNIIEPRQDCSAQQDFPPPSYSNDLQSTQDRSNTPTSPPLEYPPSYEDSVRPYSGNIQLLYPELRNRQTTPPRYSTIMNAVSGSSEVNPTDGRSPVAARREERSRPPRYSPRTGRSSQISPGEGVDLELLRKLEAERPTSQRPTRDPYIDRALAAQRARGVHISDEDLHENSARSLNTANVRLGTVRRAPQGRSTDTGALSSDSEVDDDTVQLRHPRSRRSASRR